MLTRGDLLLLILHTHSLCPLTTFFHMIAEGGSIESDTLRFMLAVPLVRLLWSTYELRTLIFTLVILIPQFANILVVMLVIVVDLFCY